uniref:Uncharacterized protein n=1 Tax=Klebsiella phage vB-Kvc-Y10 TaxID=3236922 RepID=A0AB39CC32_9CAUD
MDKQHVLTFLREWLKYSDACVKAHMVGDALPHSQVFYPWDGLCGGLSKWVIAYCELHGIPPETEMKYRRAAGDVLKSLFFKDGLCQSYPFGQRSFHRRLCEDSNYRCPKRRRWVKETIAKLEKELSDGNH